MRCGALLFNQAARGAGSQQWRSPASDVVKRVPSKQTELFPDRELLGAQLASATVRCRFTAANRVIKSDL
jgi:hypothetical protein